MVQGKLKAVLKKVNNSDLVRINNCLSVLEENNGNHKLIILQESTESTRSIEDFTFQHVT